MQNNLIDDASKEHPPIEAIEMSESENEDNIKHQQHAVNKFNKSNWNEEKEKLEMIIQQQQMQSNHMQQYIDLCEKKIVLFDPNQHFPLKESEINTSNSHSNYTLTKDVIQFIQQRSFESVNDLINDYVSKETYINNLNQTNNNLRQDYLNLNNQYINIQLEVPQLNNEIESMRLKGKEYSQLKDTYNQTCEQNTKMNEEKVSFLNDIVNLKDHLNQRESTIESLAIILNQNQSQYQNQLNHLRSSVYHDIKREFDIHNEELYNNLENKDKEINHLKESILLLEKELITCQSYANEAESTLTSNQLQLKTQCNLNSIVTKDTSQSIAKLMSENREMNDYIISMQNDIRKLIKENESITSKYNNTKEDLDALNDKYIIVKHNYDKLELEYNAIEESHTQMSIKMKMLYVEYNLLKENSSIEIPRIKKDNNELNEHNEKVLNENNQLNLKLKMLTETIQSNEIEISNLKCKMKESKCNYDSIRELNSNLELKEKELSQSNKRLEQSILQTKDELTTKHLNQSSILYDNEKLIIERSKIIEELSNEKINNKDKDTQLNQIVKLLRDNKSTLLNYKENEFFTYEYIAYLTEITIAKDYNENIIKIEDFLYNTVKEIEWMKSKFKSKLQLISQLKEDKLNIQKEHDTLLNTNYGLECKIKASQDDNNAHKKKIKELTSHHNQYQLDTEQIRRLNDKLTHENKELREYASIVENKTDYLNESISLYETIKCFIEEIIIKISKNCLYNTNIGIYVDDLIKGNFDLIQAQRDKIAKSIINSNSNSIDAISVLNDSIDSKFKQIEFVYLNILKEINIEKRLKTNYSV